MAFSGVVLHLKADESAQPNQHGPKEEMGFHE